MGKNTLMCEMTLIRTESRSFLMKLHDKIAVVTAGRPRMRHFGPGIHSKYATSSQGAPGIPLGRYLSDSPISIRILAINDGRDLLRSYRVATDLLEGVCRSQDSCLIPFLAYQHHADR